MKTKQKQQSQRRSMNAITREERAVRDTIRANMIHRRTMLGLSQAMLGAALNPPISQQAVNNWENKNGREFPPQARLVQIAKALDTDLISLYTPGKFKSETDITDDLRHYQVRSA